MRKAIVLGLSGLLALGLGACGNEDKATSSAPKEQTKTEAVSKDQQESNVTSDIFTAAKKNVTFQDENTGEEYKILGEYLNGPTKDGMYQIHFGDNEEKSFVLNYSVKLSRNPEGKLGLLFLEEGDNTKSGQLIDYQGTRVSIITDTAEQIGDDLDHVTSGLNGVAASYEGPVKEKGFMFIKFENQDQTPKKLEIDFDAPDLLQKDSDGQLAIVPGDSETGTKQLGKKEHVTLKLSKLNK